MSFFKGILTDLKTKLLSHVTVNAAEPSSAGKSCSVCIDTGADIVRPNLSGAHTSSAPKEDEVNCIAYMHSGCPLNRRELGRASWAYLHTLAAYYPDNPTEQEKKDMIHFVREYARYYPCGYCADKTYNEMYKNPPKVNNSEEFSIWMCEIHNEVNDRMGKPIFDCSRVLERWKYGSKDC